PRPPAGPDRGCRHGSASGGRTSPAATSRPRLRLLRPPTGADPAYRNGHCLLRRRPPGPVPRPVAAPIAPTRCLPCPCCLLVGGPHYVCRREGDRNLAALQHPGPFRP